MTIFHRVCAAILATSVLFFSLPARADVWSDLQKTAPLSADIGAQDTGDAMALAGE
ncbi:MAG: hypothetical protein R3D67_02275 [Hyphomicrobiaceae bacterium]